MNSRSRGFGLFVIATLLGACSAAPQVSDSATASALLAMATPGVDESALDRTVDPCTDFYQFACGGYIASLPSDTEYEVRGFSELQQARNELYGRAIDAIRAEPRTPGERAVAAFYQSCMTPFDPAAMAPYAASFRGDLEVARTPSDFARMVARLQPSAEWGFFSAFPQDAVASPSGGGRRGNFVAGPGGWDFFTNYTNADVVAKRIAILSAEIVAVDPSLGADAATAMATTAVGIEQKLFTAPGVHDSAGSEHPIGEEGLEIAAPHFDWKSYFGALGRSDDLGAFPVAAPEYFAAVDQILTTTSLEDLHAYVLARWYEGHYQIPLGPESCAESAGISFADAIQPRFLELAGVDESAQANAQAMFRAIVDAFGAELESEPFLDVPTRIEAQLKLEKMRGAIGASQSLDTYDDFEIDPSAPYSISFDRVNQRLFQRELALVGMPLPLLRVDDATYDVNAAYSPLLNTINVPGGILGGYFFSPNAPKLANFAALGAVLGHELTHGFDNNGRLVDGDGVIRDWWSPSVATAFDARAQCLSQQYSAFPVPDVIDPKTGAPAHVDGARTLPENIADNGGLKTAYRASKVESMAGSGAGSGPRAPGFTPAQQFFVGYAQLWCTKASADVEAELLATDVHAPSKARVNLTLANFDAFGSAFQCAAGSAMAPKDRCGVW